MRNIHVMTSNMTISLMNVKNEKCTLKDLAIFCGGCGNGLGFFNNGGCGCGCDNNSGCGSWIWILLLLCCCGNGCGSNSGCGCC